MRFLLLIALSTWFRDGPLAGSWLAAAGLVFCCLVIFMSPLPSLGVALRKGLSGGSQTALSSGVAVNLSKVRACSDEPGYPPPFFSSEYMYLEATFAHKTFPCVWSQLVYSAPTQTPLCALSSTPSAMLLLVCDGKTLAEKKFKNYYQVLFWNLPCHVYIWMHWWWSRAPCLWVPFPWFELLGFGCLSAGWK